MLKKSFGGFLVWLIVSTTQHVQCTMCLLRFASSKCPLTTTFNFSNYSIKSVFRQRWFSSAVDVNTNVAKDVILYKYDNPKHFKWVNIFSLCQFGFWGYLSYFSFTTLRDAPVPVDPDAEVAWWRKINLGDNKYRNTIAISAFLIGMRNSQLSLVIVSYFKF